MRRGSSGAGELETPANHYRDARIRTGDPRHPKAVRYQAAPRPGSGASVAHRARAYPPAGPLPRSPGASVAAVWAAASMEAK